MSFISDLSHEIGEARRIMTWILAANLSSFATVAMEKSISRYSPETAAFVNSLHAVPLLYDIGFDLGHEIFYNDPNFLETKKTANRVWRLI